MSDVATDRRSRVRAIENLLSQRTDLSPFLVHFTRDAGAPPVPALDNLLSILRDRRLEARTVYGMGKQLARRFPAVADAQKTVCFTETPLERARMMCAEIAGRRSQFKGYGLAFTKAFARRRGANPVWYLDQTPGHPWLTVPVGQLVDDAVTAATSGAADPGPVTLAEAPILRLTPFMEQMGNPSGKPKEFSWEREWRHVGDFDFGPADLVAVLAPEQDHVAIHDALVLIRGFKATMPGFIDVEWDQDRITAALTDAPEADPVSQELASG